MLLGPVPARARRRQAAKLREGARWMIESAVDDISLQTGDLDPEMRRALVQRLVEREEAPGIEGEDDGEPAGVRPRDRRRGAGLSARCSGA